MRVAAVLRRLAGAEHPPTPVPEPEPAPEPAPPAPEPQPPTPEPGPPSPHVEPVEWNIWELDRLARQNGGDSARHEELSALLRELRRFANPEGRLPAGFDPIVRESFGDVLAFAV
jgi:hypothetical protein